MRRKWVPDRVGRVSAGPRAAERMRFEALDSWRGLAAVMVVLFHAQILSHVHGFAVVRAGEAFVDFFFVLSGFVITHAYADRIRSTGDVSRFLFLRLGRIYPLHLVMLAAFLAFEMAKLLLPQLANPADPAFSDGNALQTLPANLALLHSMRIDGLLSWNTPSWSISAEFVAYVAFGMAMLRGGRVAILSALAVVVLAPAVLALATRDGMETTAQFGGVRALYGFSFGLLVYLALGRTVISLRLSGPSRHGFAGWTLVEAATALAACTFAVLSHGTAFAYALPPVFGAVVAVFAVERGGVSSLLRLRPLMFLGLISYSLYMTHMFVQLRFTNLARLADTALGTEAVVQLGTSARHGSAIDSGSLWIGDMLVGVMLAVTIAVSWLSWRWIEAPFNHRFRRWASRLADAPRPHDEKGPRVATP